LGQSINQPTTMAFKFFTFSQNNSGGYYVQDGVVDQVVVVEADHADDADSRASAKGLFSYHSCDCCGPRFCGQYDKAKGFRSVKAAVSSSWMQSPSVVVHFKDGRVEKA